MENYVLNLGSFAFEHWWQVGLATSAVILYVLYSVIPFVILTLRIILNRDTGDYEGILASCALIPLIGIIVGVIFWDENQTMLKVYALLISVFFISFLGCILRSAGII